MKDGTIRTRHHVRTVTKDLPTTKETQDTVQGGDSTLLQEGSYHRQVDQIDITERALNIETPLEEMAMTPHGEIFLIIKDAVSVLAETFKTDGIIIVGIITTSGN